MDGLESCIKNSDGPNGGLVFMQEIDLVGDHGKKKNFSCTGTLK